MFSFSSYDKDRWLSLKLVRLSRSRWCQSTPWDRSRRSAGADRLAQRSTWSDRRWSLCRPCGCGRIHLKRRPADCRAVRSVCHGANWMPGGEEGHTVRCCFKRLQIRRRTEATTRNLREAKGEAMHRLSVCRSPGRPAFGWCCHDDFWPLVWWGYCRSRRCLWTRPRRLRRARVATLLLVRWCRGRTTID